MKETRRVVSYVVACAVALAMVSNVAAQSVQRTAKVVRLKGAARFSTGNNLWQTLDVGTRLREGTIIQTAVDSYVDIVLDESSPGVSITTSAGAPATGLAYRPTVEQDVIRMFADTTLAIERLTKMDTGIDEVTETQLDLSRGKIFGSVKKLSNASRYEIKIPNGVAGIRGTSYMISADGVVSVFSGSVVIAYTQMGPDGQPVIGPDGKPVIIKQVVMAGFQFDPRTGEVTPISEEFIQLNPPPTPQPTTFVEDQTVYFVSPTTDDGQSGGDGGFEERAARR